MAERHDAKDIARLLGERIERLAPQLLTGRPMRDGDLWRWGSIAGEEGQSLCVWVRGPKRGRWFEFNGGFGGDGLDLVAQAVCNGDLGRALEWARDWLGLGDLMPEELAKQKQRAERAAAERGREDVRRRAHRMADAKAIWLAASPLSPGDVVWRYLAGRGIDLAALPRVPGALRCHPGLKHKAGGVWPAMVAAISGLVDGQWVHVATQRTWLDPQSNGEVKKAPLGPDAKMSLGPYRHAGGAVHLTRGASGKPWGQAAEGESVGIAEGIEDALTVATWRPQLRVAACATSLAYLGQVALPPGCAGVIVIGQNDPKGSDALKAQRRGIEGLRSRGYAVSVLRPPLWVKDVNDYAQWQRQAMTQQSATETART